VEIVSLHRPCAQQLSLSAALTAPLPHTYLPRYTESIHYCADSRGTWRYGRPTEQQAFRDGRSMQILTHPVWWDQAKHSPHTSLTEFAERHNRRLRESIAANCSAFPATKPAPDVQRRRTRRAA
jgi:hypothetical protein